MSANFNTGAKKIGGHLQSSQLSPNQALAQQLNPILVPNLRPSPLWTPQPNLSDTTSSDDSESDSQSGDGESDSDDEEDLEDELQSDYDEEDAEDAAACSTSTFPSTSNTFQVSVSANNPVSNGGNSHNPRLAWSPLSIDEEVSQAVGSPDSETEAIMNVDRPLHPRGFKNYSWSLLSIEPSYGTERGTDMDIEESSSRVDANDTADTSFGVADASFQQPLAAIGNRLARKLSCLSIDDQYSSCYFPNTSKSNGQHRFYLSDEDDGDQEGEAFSTPYFPIKKSKTPLVRRSILFTF